MKKLLFVLALLNFKVTAQNLLGEWKNHHYGYYFKFEKDKKYRFDFPENKIVNVNGTYIKTQNEVILNGLNSKPIKYNYRFSGSNKLYLFDSQGTFVLDRIGKEEVLLSTDKFSKIIAQKAQFTLRELNIKTFEVLFNILIDEKITLQDYKLIEKEMIKSFNENPETTLTEAEDLRIQLNDLFTKGDFYSISQFRQLFLGIIYEISQKEKTNDTEVFWSIINKYLKVVAFDASKKTVLTSKDLEAYLKYIDVYYEYNKLTKLEAKAKNSLKSETISGFSTLNKNEQLFLANAHIALGYLKANAEILGVSNGNQIKNNQSQPINTTDYSEKKWNANSYKMMSQLMMQNHASTLNVIENMGGTGNYWEIKPSYSW